MSERDASLTRRALLVGTGTLLALSGCQRTSDSAEPVTIGDEENCDQCGMVISEHPGPVGLAYYRDHTPSGHANPARFCSTTCTYRHRFAKEELGWTAADTFLTDYSAVDYEVRRDGGAAVLTSPLEAEAFTDAAALTVVANSDVQGAMGTAIVPFSDTGDAEAFAEEYGGRTLRAEDIPRELVSRG